MVRRYVLNERDREEFRLNTEDRRGRQRTFPAPQRRARRSIGSVSVTGGGGSGGDAIIVLIDMDIDPGAEEANPPDKLPAGDDVDELDIDEEGNLCLWNFKPLPLDVKYFVTASSPGSGVGTGTGDSDDVWMELAVAEEGAGTGTGTGGTGTGTDDKYVYLTRRVYYLDGETFIRPKYTRADYPEWDENTVFPPPSLDEDYLKKRYRAQAKKDSSGRYWLDMRTCKALPAPSPLPSVGTGT